MSNILQAGDKQKFISKVKKLSEKDGMVEYEIEVNGALQKEVYEMLYQEKAKNVEIKGFRKGKAPREMVEPQIYEDLTKDLVNVMVNYATNELVAEKVDGVILGRPVVTDYKFSVVESPITFKVKVFLAKDIKLPDVTKYKKYIKEPEVKVDDSEVEKAIEQIFAEWQSKAKPEDKEAIKEPNDKWVEKLNIPNIRTLKELKERIKADIEHSKLHEYTAKALETVLAKIMEDIKLELPEEFLDKAVEDRIAQEEENIKKYGITLEQYLEYYKKSLDEFKKEIRQDVEKRTKEELFWALYIKQYDINVDLKDPKDQVYLNYAVSALRIPQDAQLTSALLGEIIKVARMYKAVEDLQRRLGLHVHEHEHDHGTDSKGTDEKTEKADGKEEKKSDKKDNPEDTNSKSKILIPGKDN